MERDKKTNEMSNQRRENGGISNQGDPMTEKATPDSGRREFLKSGAVVAAAGCLLDRVNTTLRRNT